MVMLHSSRVISTQEVASLQHKIQLEAPGKILIKRLWKQIDCAPGFITGQTPVLLNHQRERSRRLQLCLAIIGTQSYPWQQAWEGKVFSSKLVIVLLLPHVLRPASGISCVICPWSERTTKYGRLSQLWSRVFHWGGEPCWASCAPLSKMHSDLWSSFSPT